MNVQINCEELYPEDYEYYYDGSIDDITSSTISTPNELDESFEWGVCFTSIN